MSISNYKEYANIRIIPNFSPDTNFAIPAFHEREVFPSHREVVITVNNGDSSFTGTSGTIAWELEDLDAHLIVMWSVPYNLNIYNSYFGIGVVQLKTRFSREMLPYWYNQMIEHKQGRTFQRGLGGDHLVYKHEQFFVIGEFERGYHPLLNIRYCSDQQLQL